MISIVLNCLRGLPKPKNNSLWFALGEGLNQIFFDFSFYAINQDIRIDCVGAPVFLSLPAQRNYRIAYRSLTKSMPVLRSLAHQFTSLFSTLIFSASLFVLFSSLVTLGESLTLKLSGKMMMGSWFYFKRHWTLSYRSLIWGLILDWWFLYDPYYYKGFYGHPLRLYFLRLPIIIVTLHLTSSRRTQSLQLQTFRALLFSNLKYFLSIYILYYFSFIEVLF